MSKTMANNGITCVKSNQNSLEAYSVHNRMQKAKKQIYAYLSKKNMMMKINKEDESDESDQPMQTKLRTTHLAAAKKDHSTDMISSHSSQRRIRKMAGIAHSKGQSNKQLISDISPRSWIKLSARHSDQHMGIETKTSREQLSPKRLENKAEFSLQKLGNKCIRLTSNMLTKVECEQRIDDKFSGRGKYVESDLQTVTRECGSSQKPSQIGRVAEFIHTNDDIQILHISQ